MGSTKEEVRIEGNYGTNVRKGAIGPPNSGRDGRCEPRSKNSQEE